MVEYFVDSGISPLILTRITEQSLRDIENTIPIFYSKMVPKYLLDVKNDMSHVALEALHDATVLCVSAIGSADAFVKSIYMDYNIDPEILKCPLHSYTVLVLCSELQITPFEGVDGFESTLTRVLAAKFCVCN